MKERERDVTRVSVTGLRASEDVVAVCREVERLHGLCTRLVEFAKVHNIGKIRVRESQILFVPYVKILNELFRMVGQETHYKPNGYEAELIKLREAGFDF